MMPAGDPLVYEIQFVSAVDGSITKRFSVKSGMTQGRSALVNTVRRVLSPQAAYEQWA